MAIQSAVTQCMPDKFFNQKRDPSSWRSDYLDSCAAQTELKQAHEEAFEKVQNPLKEEVIEMKTVLLSTLLRVYRDSLKGTKFVGTAPGN